MSNSNNCVCYRDSKTVLCLKCKLFSRGRIQTECPRHRNVTFLFDYQHCQNCRAPAKYLKEIDVDLATIKTAVEVTMKREEMSKEN